MASAVAKPDGLLVVPPGHELDFLHPLAVERLWGVGAVTSRKLRDRGLVTVGQVARLAEPSLVSILGPAAGRRLYALAHNRDPRRVRGRRRRRSMGAQRALGRFGGSHEALDAVLIGLVDRLTRRLRGARRVCRTVTIRLRFADFSRATRSHTLAEATSHTPAILAAARELLVAARALVDSRGITLLGVSLANLDDGRAIQLALPLDRAQPHALDAALDDIRDRFGSAAVTRATLLGREQGPTVPLLPD